MLIDKSTPLSIVIPSIGIFLSVLIWSISSGMIRELRLWLVICQKIEQEEETFKDLKERERIPHSAWNYWWEGESTYIMKEEHPLYSKLAPLTRWEKRIYYGILNEWKMYRFYIPGMFFAIWMTSLIWILLAN